MPSTTNFGWTTPADTDLVKDGASAIRTLGNGIDTSFVDLKGGTTGQVLAKNSNTDLDFVWIANDQGDITEVVAGTGLTGGGTAGSVTLSLSTPVSATNGGTAQTTYTTGDILYASASNTLSKRAIGTTGQILTVSGGIPTWATPASSTPTFVGCFLYKASNQTLSDDTSTVLTFTAEEIDTDGFHDNSTNTGRITIPTGKGGKYLFIGYASFAPNASGSRAISFTKNGTSTIASPTRIFTNTESGSDTRVNGQVIANLNAGDYVEMTGYQKSGGNLNVQGDSVDTFRTKFGCVYLGA